jgi:hypothetical protein
MFGLDHYIAGASDGTTFLIVAAVACLLGLRHATDPDHLAAVATLTAGNRSGGGSQAARLGFSWGIGHATSLFAFGLPIVLFKAYLPEDVQRGAEVSVGIVIVSLAVWLLLRWRRGFFHLHLHEHGGGFRSRSPLQAYGIGLVHGTGGSAGVGVLLLATIHDQVVACLALALFAACTALSMALLSTGFGLTLGSGPVRRGFHRVAPVLALASLAFGVWYSLGALSLAPYTL